MPSIRRWLPLLLVSVAALCAACAAPLQRVLPPPPAADEAPASPRPVRVSGRSTVGVAFGGGSARGIAHVGVIRWLEEHRIPIDMAAGTSMGGLVGGAFATGMDARELEDFIDSLDWDQLFGASSFAYKNIRRKADARAYPSRLEFGLKGGIVPPAALNNGEYVELLLGRIAAPYFGVEDFDDLPTPFRTVAVDLLSAQPVVLRKRLARRCDAGHDVAAADLSARGAGWAGTDRRRHDEQRARRHRQGDGRRPCRCRQRRRSVRSRRLSPTRCSGSRAIRSTR